MKENAIERLICDYLHAKRYFFYKSPTRGYFSGSLKNIGGRNVMVGSFRKDLNPYARRGVPDLIVIKQGKYIGLEIKSATGRQSESQTTFEEDLKKAGGEYFIVRNLEDVILALGEKS